MRFQITKCAKITASHRCTSTRLHDYSAGLVTFSQVGQSTVRIRMRASKRYTRDQYNIANSISLALRSLTIKRSCYDVTDLSPIAHLSVCLSVCLSGQRTVAKRLYGSGCHLGWVGQAIRQLSSKGTLVGEFRAFQCNQWGRCCVVVQK